MDSLNDLNERVDAFVGTSSFETPAATSGQAPIDVPAEVHEDIVASVDFSEVELADEFTEPQVAVTPNGLLPMEPLPIDGRLRKAALRMPDEIEEASGFTLFGRRIKSLIYTTDVAVIRNSNADAVFAVYPFTPQPAITQALLTVAECPVFVGVGGGTTTGKRSVQMAAVSEMQGAAGCVVNSPATAEMVEHITNIADIPVIATVVRCDNDAHAKVRAGAKILNIAAGKNTPQVLRELREHYPNLPLIAPGGKTPESIRETIAAGANAIIWTLAVNLLISGVIRVVWQGKMLYAEDIAKESMQSSAEKFYAISRTYIGGAISLMAIVMLVMFVISWVIHTKTAFGQKLKIIGTNYEVAKFSGINCTKQIIIAYVINGLCSATAGIFYAALRKCASYENGTGYDFDALTAILLGGVSLNGGKGSIVGTFGGVLAYGILNNILSWIGLGTYTKYLVQGIVFLFIVWLNTHSNRKLGKA